MSRLAQHPVIEFVRGKKISFEFEGRKLGAFEGETIAAALHAEGIRFLRSSPGRQRAQGFFCAIGKCSSCLMEVDGMPNVRTCITLVRDGMVVRRQKGKGELLE